MHVRILALACCMVLGSGLRAVEPIDWKAARQFWSFRPVVKPTVPGVKDNRWARTDIDRFILARLEEKKLKPVGPAGKRELIRRATFDLTGLPPTPEDVDAFLKDESPDAFGKVIDRLLKSPHYGERWGRHWLDVARYAEDQAHTFGVKPYSEAWRYRDWVIDAMNSDMPFDRFVKLQLAADQMNLNDDDRRRHFAALGFMGLGAQYYKNSDAARAAADELDDRIDTVTRGLLGLTVSCSRCHDHKFDPIPIQDYYSLAGVFASTKLVNAPIGSKDEVTRFEQHQQTMKELDDSIKAVLRKERAEMCKPIVAQSAQYLQAVRQFQDKVQVDSKWTLERQAQSSGLDGSALARWVKFLESKPRMPGLDGWNKLARTSSATDIDRAAEEFQKQLQLIVAESTETKPLSKQKSDLLQAMFGDKGVHALPDGEVKKRMAAPRRQEMDKKQADLAQLQKSAPALPMAHAVAESNVADMKVYLRGNPATQGDPAPRRFLQILAGDNPPKFAHGSGRLDLADAIVARDNPLTARVIVNRIWAWHFGRGLVASPSNFGNLGERPSHPELLDYLAARFVESGWSIKALQRDIMNSAVYQSGSGRSETNEAIDADNVWLWRMTPRRLDVESWRDAMLAVAGKLDPKLGGPTFDLSNNTTRRTVYAKISRHQLDGLLRLFDFPEANLTCERRTETTVPQQQLFVLNSPFVIDMAKALAARVQKEAKHDTNRIDRLSRLAFGRAPTADEAKLMLEFVQRDDPAEDKASVKMSRWERLAQAVLGSNEFLYVD